MVVFDITTTTNQPSGVLANTEVLWLFHGQNAPLFSVRLSNHAQTTTPWFPERCSLWKKHKSGFDSVSTGRLKEVSELLMNWSLLIPVALKSKHNSFLVANWRRRLHWSGQERTSCLHYRSLNNRKRRHILKLKLPLCRRMLLRSAKHDRTGVSERRHIFRKQANGEWGCAHAHTLIELHIIQNFIQNFRFIVSVKHMQLEYFGFNPTMRA